MTTAVNDVPLPPAYRRAVQRLAGSEIALDWRRIASREPPVWPGVLYLWADEEALSENARLADKDLFYFGTNTAGLLFALDRQGQVRVIDDVERDEGVVIADSFEGLLVARVPPRRGAPREDPRRGFTRAWAKIEELAAQPKSFEYASLYDRVMALHAEYKAQGLLPEFEARLRDFRAQHKGKRVLMAKLAAAGAFGRER